MWEVCVKRREHSADTAEGEPYLPFGMQRVVLICYFVLVLGWAVCFLIVSKHFPMKGCVCAQSLSPVRLCDPRDCILQAPLSMQFPRQEHWNGLPFPPPRDRPDLGIEPTSLASPALAGRLFTTAPPGKVPYERILYIIFLELLGEL